MITNGNLVFPDFSNTQCLDLSASSRLYANSLSLILIIIMVESLQSGGASSSVQFNEFYLHASTHTPKTSHSVCNNTSGIVSRHCRVIDRQQSPIPSLTIATPLIKRDSSRHEGPSVFISLKSSHCDSGQTVVANPPTIRAAKRPRVTGRFIKRRDKPKIIPSGIVERLF